MPNHPNRSRRDNPAANPEKALQLKMRLALEWYTATRWDVALPEGHPYKDVPFDEQRFRQIAQGEDRGTKS